jgi:malate dehydrogenase (oxaloacetate-decarboxylating)
MPTRDDLLAKAQQPVAEALRLYPFYHGKVQMQPWCSIRDFRDFAIW